LLGAPYSTNILMMEFAAYSRSVSEYSEFTRFGPYLLGLCLSPTPACKACRSKSDFLDTPLARQVISGLEVVFRKASLLRILPSQNGLLRHETIGANECGFQAQPV
jgi:hypothetical protein